MTLVTIIVEADLTKHIIWCSTFYITPIYLIPRLNRLISPPAENSTPALTTTSISNTNLSTVEISNTHSKPLLEACLPPDVYEDEDPKSITDIGLFNWNKALPNSNKRVTLLHFRTTYPHLYEELQKKKKMRDNTAIAIAKLFKVSCRFFQSRYYVYLTVTIVSVASVLPLPHYATPMIISTFTVFFCSKELLSTLVDHLNPLIRILCLKNGRFRSLIPNTIASDKITDRLLKIFIFVYNLIASIQFKMEAQLLNRQNLNQRIISLMKAARLMELPYYIERSPAYPVRFYQLLKGMKAAFFSRFSSCTTRAKEGKTEMLALTNSPSMLALNDSPRMLALIDSPRMLALTDSPRTLAFADSPATADNVKYCSVPHKAYRPSKKEQKKVSKLNKSEKKFKRSVQKNFTTAKQATNSFETNPIYIKMEKTIQHQATTIEQMKKIVVSTQNTAQSNAAVLAQVLKQIEIIAQTQASTLSASPVVEKQETAIHKDLVLPSCPQCKTTVAQAEPVLKTLVPSVDYSAQVSPEMTPAAIQVESLLSPTDISTQTDPCIILNASSTKVSSATSPLAIRNTTASIKTVKQEKPDLIKKASISPNQKRGPTGVTPGPEKQKRTSANSPAQVQNKLSSSSSSASPTQVKRASVRASPTPAATSVSVQPEQIKKSPVVNEKLKSTSPKKCSSDAPPQLHNVKDEAFPPLKKENLSIQKEKPTAKAEGQDKKVSSSPILRPKTSPKKSKKMENSFNLKDEPTLLPSASFATHRVPSSAEQSFTDSSKSAAEKSFKAETSASVKKPSAPAADVAKPSVPAADAAKPSAPVVVEKQEISTPSEISYKEILLKGTRSNPASPSNSPLKETQHAVSPLKTAQCSKTSFATTQQASSSSKEAQRAKSSNVAPTSSSTTPQKYLLPGSSLKASAAYFFPEEKVQRTESIASLEILSAEPCSLRNNAPRTTLTKTKVTLENEPTSARVTCQSEQWYQNLIAIAQSDSSSVNRKRLMEQIESLRKQDIDMEYFIISFNKFRSSLSNPISSGESSDGNGFSASSRASSASKSVKSTLLSCNNKRGSSNSSRKQNSSNMKGSAKVTTEKKPQLPLTPPQSTLNNRESLKAQEKPCLSQKESNDQQSVSKKQRPPPGQQQQQVDPSKSEKLETHVTTKKENAAPKKEEKKPEGPQEVTQTKWRTPSVAQKEAQQKHFEAKRKSLPSNSVLLHTTVEGSKTTIVKKEHSTIDDSKIIFYEGPISVLTDRPPLIIAKMKEIYNTWKEKYPDIIKDYFPHPSINVIYDLRLLLSPEITDLLCKVTFDPYSRLPEGTAVKYSQFGMLMKLSIIMSETNAVLRDKIVDMITNYTYYWRAENYFSLLRKREKFLENTVTHIPNDNNDVYDFKENNMIVLMKSAPMAGDETPENQILPKDKNKTSPNKSFLFPFNIDAPLTSEDTCEIISMRPRRPSLSPVKYRPDTCLSPSTRVNHLKSSDEKKVVPCVTKIKQAKESSPSQVPAQVVSSPTPSKTQARPYEWKSPVGRARDGTPLRTMSVKEVLLCRAEPARFPRTSSPLPQGNVSPAPFKIEELDLSPKKQSKQFTTSLPKDITKKPTVASQESNEMPSISAAPKTTVASVGNASTDRHGSAKPQEIDNKNSRNHKPATTKDFLSSQYHYEHPIPNNKHQSSDEPSALPVEHSFIGKLPSPKKQRDSSILINPPIEESFIGKSTTTHKQRESSRTTTLPVEESFVGNLPSPKKQRESFKPTTLPVEQSFIGKLPSPKKQRESSRPTNLPVEQSFIGNLPSPKKQRDSSKPTTLPVEESFVGNLPSPKKQRESSRPTTLPVEQSFIGKLPSPKKQRESSRPATLPVEESFIGKLPSPKKQRESSKSFSLPVEESFIGKLPSPKKQRDSSTLINPPIEESFIGKSTTTHKQRESSKAFSLPVEESFIGKLPSPKKHRDSSKPVTTLAKDVASVNSSRVIPKSESTSKPSVPQDTTSYHKANNEQSRIDPSSSIRNHHRQEMTNELKEQQPLTHSISKTNPRPTYYSFHSSDMPPTAIEGETIEAARLRVIVEFETNYHVKKHLQTLFTTQPELFHPERTLQLYRHREHYICLSVIRTRPAIVEADHLASEMQRDAVCIMKTECNARHVQNEWDASPAKFHLLRCTHPFIVECIKEKLHAKPYLLTREFFNDAIHLRHCYEKSFKEYLSKKGGSFSRATCNFTTGLREEDRIEAKRNMREDYIPDPSYPWLLPDIVTYEPHWKIFSSLHKAILEDSRLYLKHNEARLIDLRAELIEKRNDTAQVEWLEHLKDKNEKAAREKKEQQMKEEEDRKRKEEEDRRRKEEEDRRRKEEEDRRRKEEEDRRRKEEEDRKRREERNRKMQEDLERMIKQRIERDNNIRREQEEREKQIQSRKKAEREEKERKDQEERERRDRQRDKEEKERRERREREMNDRSQRVQDAERSHIDRQRKANCVYEPSITASNPNNHSFGSNGRQKPNTIADDCNSFSFLYSEDIPSP